MVSLRFLGVSWSHCGDGRERVGLAVTMEVIAGSESVPLWVTVLLDWFVTGLMEGFFCLKELGWRIPDGLFPEVSERVPLFPRKKVFPKFCPKRFYGVFCPCCEVLGCLIGCERTEKRSNSTQVEEHRSAISRSSGFFPLTGLFLRTCR